VFLHGSSFVGFYWSHPVKLAGKKKLAGECKKYCRISGFCPKLSLPRWACPGRGRDLRRVAVAPVAVLNNNKPEAYLVPAELFE
jgi:hypothetical protein